MKTASMLAAALVMVSSLPVMAQQADAAPQQNPTANGPWRQVNPPGPATTVADNTQGSAARANGMAAVPASTPRRLFPVHAELEGKLDSKSAKLGDPVVLKTREAIKTADGMEIPKGSLIVGHVTLVEAHGKGSENSQVAVELDRAELKGGQTLAIRSAILSVTALPDPSTSAMLRSVDDLGGGAMSNATQVMGGVSMGDNKVLTATGAMLKPNPSVPDGLNSVESYGVQPPSQASNQAAAGHSVWAVGGAAAMAHATGVSGVLLASDLSGRISGTFSAMKQNVRLDGGTRVVLGIATAK